MLTGLLTIVGFIMGIAVGGRIVKLAVKVVNGIFDRIEEKI